MRRSKTYRKTYTEKQNTFGRGKNYCTLKTAAFILEVVFLLEN